MCHFYSQTSGWSNVRSVILPLKLVVLVVSSQTDVCFKEKQADSSLVKLKGWWFILRSQTFGQCTNLTMSWVNLALILYSTTDNYTRAIK